MFERWRLCEIHEISILNGGLPAGVKTIADYLGRFGYVNGLVGKWELGKAPQFHPLNCGFDDNTMIVFLSDNDGPIDPVEPWTSRMRPRHVRKQS